MKKFRSKMSLFLFLIMLTSSMASPVKVIGQSLVNRDELEGRDRNSEVLIEKNEEEIEEKNEEEIEEKDEDKNEEKNEEEIEEKDEDKNEEKDDGKDEDKELATIYVDIEAEEDGDGSQEKPFKSMDQAIEYVNGQEGKMTTIKVAKGIYDLQTVETEFEPVILIEEDTSILGEEGVELKLNGPLFLGKMPESGNMPEINENKTNISIENLKISVNKVLDDKGIGIISENSNLIMENVELGNVDIEEDDQGKEYNALEIEGFGSEIKLKNIKNLGEIHLFESKLDMEDVEMGYGFYSKYEDEIMYSYASIHLESSNADVKRLTNLGEIHLFESKLDMEDVEMNYSDYFKDNPVEHYMSGLIHLGDSNADIKNIKNLGEIHVEGSTLVMEDADMSLSMYEYYDGEVTEEPSMVHLGESNFTLKNAKNLGIIHSMDSNIDLDKVELENINADAYSDNLNKKYVFSMKDSQTKNLLEGEKIEDCEYLCQGLLIEGYDEINIDNFKYRNNPNGMEINSNCENPDSSVSINNLSIENVIWGPGAIIVRDAGKLDMKNIDLKNNIDSIIHLDNSDYYIEDLNISTDKELDKLIEMYKEEIIELGQEWEIDELLLRYGLISNCFDSQSMEDLGENKGVINGFQVDLNNKTIERNWLNLEFRNMEEKINKFNVKSNGMNNLQTCFHSIESDILLTNSSLGELENTTALAFEIIDSNWELVNNTIVNHELGNENIKGLHLDIEYFPLDSNEIANKINNNILDIKKGKILEEIECDCYENIIKDSQLNNNIFLNLEEDDLSKEDKDNIFLDDYKDIKFKDKFELQIDKMSPAVDKGNNDYLAEEYDRDLADNPRISNKIIDIGAYEYQKIKYVDYIIRYVDEDGKDLLDKIEKTGKENEEIRVEAEDIKGYELVGDREKTLVLKYGQVNELVFKYKKIKDTETPEIPEEPETPEEPEKPELNKKNHFAYIVGYEDGSVGPDNKMVREEVAAVFFRLLDPEYRESIRTASHDFPDFSKDKWSAKHIGSLANGGIVSGNERGEFLPDNVISRAEVASIAARFADENPKTDKKAVDFTDIKGHWAEDHIRIAADLGWIVGYEDGSFRPDEKISRAEFISLVNGVLDRKVNKENILEGIKDFTDIDKKAWYYEALVEASNGHVYNEERLEDGSEEWLELKDFNVEM